MKYIQHLSKINALRGRGTPGLWLLVVRYNVARLFWRPALARLVRGNRYGQQKKLLYTVMTGSYDRLNEIPEMLPNWDYVCYTDNPRLASKTWRVELLENELGLDPIRLSRHFKINNHLIDQGYDLSVYLDANIRIRGDLDSFLDRALPPDRPFAILHHPFLGSLAEEVAKCVAVGKENEEILQKQYDHYTRKEGFTDPFPHINARMMIRRSGNREVRRLMETWFAQLLTWSRRDQVAFNYALSLCPEAQPHYVPYWMFRSYFKKMDHSS